ncbi:hypothetical protein FB451DRAFT_1351527 [Mycena latifolia]|nr:hypothetical protein FB451DRAFT_1351527 [Mycena latifolia]
MPRPAKPLPDGVEQDSASKKVRCIICKDGDPMNNGKWIDKKSLTGHLESAQHLAQVANKCERDKQAAEKARRLEETYSGAPADPIQASDPSPALHAEMYSGDQQRSPSPSWADYEAAGLNAPAIPSFITRIIHDPDAERAQLREQVEQMLSRSEESDDEEDELGNTINALKDLGLETEGDEIDAENYFSNIPIDTEYSPYPNKVSMLLDILDNLPCLRMSSNQLKMILWILKECKVTSVPSYSAFRQMQEHLRGLCGSEPKAYTSSIGNRFFVNDVRESIARDFSNPEVVKHLNFYPEETSGPISEVWQAEHWKEFKPSELTPMYSRGLRQFYIEEVAELQSGKMVIPLAWIKRGGVLCADYLDVIPAVTGWKIGQDVQSVPAIEFRFNYHDIVERIGNEIPWAVTSNAPKMPNPLRELADGDDLYVVMVPMWADDVSGNKSKQYNKHMNMYMANSNLPGQLLQQEYFVRFVSTSPHAGSPEQFSAIKEQIQATQTDPIRCYNAETCRNCRVILRVPSLPADNPQQSEEVSHMGGNANYGCRRCMAGGPHEHTESDEGYHSMHYAGLPRFAAQTKKTLEEQIRLATYGVEAPISKLQTATGVKDKVAQYWINILLEKARQMKVDKPGRNADSIATELQTWLENQPGDKINPLLDIAGLDPNRDTPVELLHTILLGIIKYVWHLLHTEWTETQQNLFVIRLQSTDIDGLSIPPIRAAYMMQYKNGLIGKHFKTLMQTMVFHMHGLVPPEVFTLVKAVSALGSVLWVHEIDDMTQYTEHLKILIANVLDAFGDNDPAKILLKIKLHLLPHIVEDVVFECFNAIFRLCSILSNHQAPSRDIAKKFASMDRLKHILSGGFWKQGDEWVRAAANVLNILQTMPIIQRHLGWAPPRKLEAGKMRLASQKKSPSIRWKETQSASSSNAFAICSTAHWRSAISVTAQSGDNSTIVGRISELLTQDGCTEGVPGGVVTLEQFIVSEKLHPDFEMPVLQRPADTDPQVVTIRPEAILFRFSAQHDCHLADCQPTALRWVVQERQETLQTTKLICHEDDDHFIVNMAALHNATLLRRVLPIALTVPRPIHLDRKAHHFEIAAGLRVSQVVKRARTQEKRKATIAAKKSKAASARIQEEVDIGSGDEDSDEEMEDDGIPVSTAQKRPRKKAKKS